MVANPWIAETLKWLHPMRTSRYLFSERFNPWMIGVSQVAGTLWPQRYPLPEEHPFLEVERDLISGTFDLIERAREFRDAAWIHAFDLIYGHRVHQKQGAIRQIRALISLLRKTS